MASSQGAQSVHTACTQAGVALKCTLIDLFSSVRRKRSEEIILLHLFCDELPGALHFITPSVSISGSDKCLTGSNKKLLI